MVAAGAAVGLLGGVVGLGGAEFRLPLLPMFGLAVLPAVIVDKAVSLVVVASALLWRSGAVPLAEVAAQWPVIVNLLDGSLAGAWLAAGWATRWPGAVLQRVIAGLLLLVGVLLLMHPQGGAGSAALQGLPMVLAGLAAGLGIGIVAALLGVAGGELLIPALVLLYGVEPKLAGSVSLAISLPTMLVGFARHSRDSRFGVLRTHRSFVPLMAAGSLPGSAAGGLMLGAVPAGVLLPLLADVLFASAVKTWGTRRCRLGGADAAAAVCAGAAFRRPRAPQRVAGAAGVRSVRR